MTQKAGCCSVFDIVVLALINVTQLSYNFSIVCLLPYISSEIKTQIRCSKPGHCALYVTIVTTFFCISATCTSRCLNGGICVAPNRCTCLAAYSGLRCEICK